MNKKSISGLLAVLMIAAVAAFNVSLNSQKETLSDLAMENVEALASESGGSCCIGSRFQITPVNGGYKCTNDRGNSCCPVC